MITILSDNWMNLQWDNTHRRRSFLDCDVILFPIVTSHLLARLSICCAGLHTCMRLALWRTAPGDAGVWSGPVFLQRSDAVARIPANGSAAFNKSCAPIGKNSSATALCHSSKARPWLVCVMSNATRLGGTIRRYLRSPRLALAHGIAAPGFMPPAPAQSPPPPPTSFPIFSGKPPP